METHLIIINADNRLGGSTCNVVLLKRASVAASGQEICVILTLMGTHFSGAPCCLVYPNRQTSHSYSHFKPALEKIRAGTIFFLIFKTWNKIQ